MGIRVSFDRFDSIPGGAGRWWMDGSGGGRLPIFTRVLLRIHETKRRALVRLLHIDTIRTWLQTRSRTHERVCGAVRSLCIGRAHGQYQEGEGEERGGAPGHDSVRFDSFCLLIMRSGGIDRRGPGRGWVDGWYAVPNMLQGMSNEQVVVECLELVEWSMIEKTNVPLFPSFLAVSTDPAPRRNPRGTTPQHGPVQPRLTHAHVHIHTTLLHIIITTTTTSYNRTDVLQKPTIHRHLPRVRVRLGIEPPYDLGHGGLGALRGRPRPRMRRCGDQRWQGRSRGGDSGRLRLCLLRR